MSGSDDHYNCVYSRCWYPASTSWLTKTCGSPIPSTRHLAIYRMTLLTVALVMSSSATKWVTSGKDLSPLKVSRIFYLFGMQFVLHNLALTILLCSTFFDSTLISLFVQGHFDLCLSSFVGLWCRKCFVPKLFTSWIISVFEFTSRFLDQFQCGVKMFLYAVFIEHWLILN